MADGIFIKYRGRQGFGLNDILMSYDLHYIRSSEEFLYALENAIEALNLIGINSNRMKTRLEEYLAVLEEYE